MPHYEYKVIPAPKRGEKARGLKTTEERFANTLAEAMNRLGAEGWDYVRADCLPCEERQGLTGRTTTFQNVLVFRRVIDAAAMDWHDMPAAPAPADPVTPAVPTAHGSPPPIQPPRPGNAPALGSARPDGPQVAAPPGPSGEAEEERMPDPAPLGRTLTATRD